MSAIDFGPAPQTVLVTGATGFIGRQLVAALQAGGHRPIAVSRDPRGAAQRLGVRCVAAPGELEPGVRVDWVVNLAGARILGWPWTAARRETLLASRLGPTRALVDWLAATPHKPRLLLSASAIGWYGVQPPGDDRALAEDAPPQPVFMSELCQRWEAEAAQGWQRARVPVALLRLGVVLGRGGGALPGLLAPIRLGLGGPLGGGRQWNSWIHLDDVLGAMAHLARRIPQPEGVQAWNATAPEQLRQREFAAVAARVLRRPAVLPTPGWPMRLALGEQSDLLLQGQRVHPAALLADGYRFRQPQLEGALRELLGTR